MKRSAAHSSLDLATIATERLATRLRSSPRDPAPHAALRRRPSGGPDSSPGDVYFVPISVCGGDFLRAALRDGSRSAAQSPPPAPRRRPRRRASPSPTAASPAAASPAVPANVPANIVGTTTAKAMLAAHARAKARVSAARGEEPFVPRSVTAFYAPARGRPLTASPEPRTPRNAGIGATPRTDVDGVALPSTPPTDDARSTSTLAAAAHGRGVDDLVALHYAACEQPSPGLNMDFSPRIAEEDWLDLFDGFFSDGENTEP